MSDVRMNTSHNKITWSNIIPQIRQFYRNPELFEEYRIKRDAAILALLEEINERLKRLEDVVYSNSNIFDDSEYRLLSKNEIKKLILEFIENQSGVLYPSDIAEALNIDYMDVLNALEELIKEGKIDVSEEE